MLRRNQGPLRRNKRRNKHCASSVNACSKMQISKLTKRDVLHWLGGHLWLLLLPASMQSAVPFDMGMQIQLIGLYKLMLQTKMLTAASVGGLKMTRQQRRLYLEACQKLRLVINKQVHVLIRDNVCHEQEIAAQAGSSV